MKHSVRWAVFIALPAFLITSCAVQPVRKGTTPVKLVLSHDKNGKKIYTTPNGMAVQYEVLNETVPTRYRSYKTGPGDALEVLLENSQERNNTVYYTTEDVEHFAGMEYTRYRITIDPMGNINLPLAGEIHVAELSLNEIELSIKRKLDVYLQNPQPVVKLSAYASYSISILGEVYKPGLYEIKKPITVSEAVALGGGVTKDGTLSRIYLGRRGQKSLRMNVTEIWANGSIDDEIVLERDDVIFVPPKIWFTLTELEQVSTVLSNISNVIWQLK
jgi:protein involved in polysaccharide export with SLBB domain